MGEYRKTFVNRIYTVGLTTCGSALVRIAGATESEGFQKVASFVNKWICGGNNTGQTLAEIQALCNEILNEVKIVDQHLKEYDAEIEKMSPLSDSTNMSAIATETNLYQHIGHMFYTTVPGFIVSCVVYFIAGAHFASDSQVGQVDEIINTLGELFNLAMPVGLLLLIPCVIVIAGSLMKKPTIPVMIISSAVAIVLAMLVQGFSFTDCAASMVSGFKMEMLHTSMDLENIVEQVPNLLQRGGMSSMMNTALMAFCGFSFIGALTVCGSMELILERIMKHIHGTGQLITLTVILGVIMITVIGEATVTFLMIGGMFRPEYIKRGLESKNLSRSLEDSITVVEPLVPWSLAGVYMTSVLGVPTVQYAPWAVLCYTGVIFAIIWGFTGFGIAKIKKGSAAYEEYLELSGKTE